MQVLDNALALAKRFPVFPCAADKKPTCPKGFHAATQSEDGVMFLWGKYPGPLIGVPTGEKSGFDVLDIDPRGDGDKWLDEARDSLPISQINHTRSGGWHFLLQHTDGIKNSAGRIAPGVDTRGQGGYIVWWPSEGFRVENAGALDTWPDWLVKILLPPPPKPIPMKPVTRIEASSRASIMIFRAYERVRNAAPGQRHAQLRAAAATLGGLTRFTGRSSEQIERDLVELIMATGAQDRRNAEKTAHWAMQKGSGSPLLNGA